MAKWGSQRMRTWFQVALGVDSVFKSRNSSRFFLSFSAYSAALWLLRSAQGRGGFWSCPPSSGSLYLFLSCTYCPWKGHSFVSVLYPDPSGIQAAWRQFCLFYILGISDIMERRLNVFGEQKHLLSKLWARLLSFLQSLLVREDRCRLSQFSGSCHFWLAAFSCHVHVIVYFSFIEHWSFSFSVDVTIFSVTIIFIFYVLHRNIDLNFICLGSPSLSILSNVVCACLLPCIHPLRLLFLYSAVV